MKAYTLTFEVADCINGFGQVVSWKRYEYELLAPSKEDAYLVAGIQVFRDSDTWAGISYFKRVEVEEIRALTGKREVFELPPCLVFKI